MGAEGERLAGRLLAEGEKTVLFFHNIDKSLFDKQVYSEGGCWTVRQVLAHFAATEEAFALLVVDITAGGAGSPLDFDIDRYNEKMVKQLAGEPVEELISRFRRQRENNAKLVAGLDDQDLEREGRHPFLGQTRLEEIIKLIYRHNQIHQRDLRRAAAEQGDP
jgi:uncharacterized protein (TIGR03083 family)